MMRPLVSHKKAKSVIVALFIVALIILFFTRFWWPGIMLAIGLPLAVKQYLLGKTYDVLITLIVFIGGFFSVIHKLSWPVVLPVLFILGAIYVVYRDAIESFMMSEEEQDEDLNEEIEEDQHKH